MSFKVRLALPHEANLVASLSLAVQQMHFDARPDVFKPAIFSDELIAWYAGKLADTTINVFVGELENVPIGYIFTQIIERPESPFTYAGRGLLIDQVSVNPEHRSQGYGEQLIRHAIGFARENTIGLVVLGVWGFNVRAQAMYERIGFVTRDLRMELVLE